jgi:hypothetical protein
MQKHVLDCRDETQKYSVKDLSQFLLGYHRSGGQHDRLELSQFLEYHSPGGDAGLLQMSILIKDWNSFSS